MALGTPVNGTPATLVGTSVLPGVPVGVASGSFVSVAVTAAWPETGTAPTTAAITAPSGFTSATTPSGQPLVFIDSIDGVYVLVAWYTKIASASDVGTYTFSFASVGGQAVVVARAQAVLVPGAGTGSIVDGFQKASSSTAAGSVTPASYTPTAANTLSLAAVFDSDTVTFTVPSGWTQFTAGSAPGDITLSIQYFQQTTAAAIHPTFTASSSSFSMGALVMLLRAPSATTITGVASVSLPAPAITATSKRTAFAAATATLSGIGLSATSKRTGFATASISLPNLGITATGQRKALGIAAVTLPSLAVSVTGIVVKLGTASVSTPSLAVSATGQRKTFATATVTLPSLGVTATSKVTVLGSTSVDLGSLAISAEGTSSGTVEGSADVTLPTTEITATSQRTTFGVASVSLPALGVAASGIVVEPNVGIADIELPATEISATGQRTTFGVASVSLARLVIAAEGSQEAPVLGTAYVALPGLGVTATGRRTVFGQAVVTLAGVSINAVGNHTVKGVASVILSNLNISVKVVKWIPVGDTLQLTINLSSEVTTIELSDTLLEVPLSSSNIKVRA